MTSRDLDPKQASKPSVEPRRLATFPRGETEELRVELAEFEGRQFIGVRIWFRSTDGGWHPTKKGVSVRLRELRELARVFADPTLQMAGGARTGGKGYPRGDPRDNAMEAGE